MKLSALVGAVGALGADLLAFAQLPEESLAAPPAGSWELLPGSVWHGRHTRAMSRALGRELLALRRAGVEERVALGIDKGSLFLRAESGRFYEFAVGERGVYHLVGGRAQRVLVLRDLALGSVQLDEAGQHGFTLPPESLAALASRPVAGDPGSAAPILPLLRPLLTLIGDEHYAPDRSGQIADMSIDAAGRLGGLPDGVPALSLGRYRNGHNVPQLTDAFLEQAYGDRALAVLGLPIGEPLWMWLVTGQRSGWVLWQPFERGAVTFNPANEAQWQFEVGLAGNLFIAAFNMGSEMPPALSDVHERPPFRNAVGWAYSAWPTVPEQQIRDEIGKLRELGTNALYVSHANAARVPLDNYMTEPGLCYAVYHALVNRTSDLKGAEMVLAGLHRTLQAASDVGMQVVLAIGYQMQMGDAWNELYPDHLRRTWKGDFVNHWGVPGTRHASPYSPQYREDILRYYQWVDETFVQRYPAIVGLNLSDEPMGADYSAHALATFQRRYGTPFERASHQQQGEFMAGVIADYVSWSAEMWRLINPALWTTSTLHVERKRPWFFDLERVVELAPPGFLLSADTHWHDDIPNGGLTEESFSYLHLLCRTLGWLSAVYNRPLMPWLGANGWSMAYSESNVAQGLRVGGLPEIRRSLHTVLNETRRVGGQVAFLMGWGANIRGQELPNQQQIIAELSAEMAILRDALSAPLPSAAPPEVVLTYDPARLHKLIGEQKQDHLITVLDLTRALEERGHNVEQLLRERSCVILRRGSPAYLTAVARRPQIEIIELF